MVNYYTLEGAKKSDEEYNGLESEEDRKKYLEDVRSKKKEGVYFLLPSVGSAFTVNKNFSFNEEMF